MAAPVRSSVGFSKTDLQDACPAARKTHNWGVRRWRLSTLLLFSRFVMLPVGPATRAGGECRQLRGNAVAETRHARQTPWEPTSEAAHAPQPAQTRHARGELLHHCLHLPKLRQQLVDLGS